MALERSVVTHAQKDPSSAFGYFIVMSPADKTVDDDGWYQVWYGHMLYPTLLNVGDIVEEGGVVGYVGASGMATGPHLHLEIRNRNGVIDPFNFLLSGGIGINTATQAGVEETVTEQPTSTDAATLTTEKLVAYLNSGSAWIASADPEAQVAGVRVVRVVIQDEVT